jgi:hypothetical protein
MTPNMPNPEGGGASGSGDADCLVGDRSANTPQKADFQPHRAGVVNMRRFEKNTLRAFFDLELPSGMTVRGCTLHLSHGKHWVGLPGKSYKDQSGKENWAAIVDFKDKSARDKFQDMATEAALAAYQQLEKETT